MGILVAIAIPVFLLTRSSKQEIVNRDYILVKGHGTIWDKEIPFEKGVSVRNALDYLNFHRAVPIKEIYEKGKYGKKILDLKDLLIHDTTIWIN